MNHSVSRALPTPSLLDAQGFLATGHDVPKPERGFVVFGQASPPPFEVHTLRSYASRFLGAKVGLSAEKLGMAPARDLAFFLVLRESLKGTVPVEAREACDADRVLARSAEGGRGGGLADLAARCPRVFVVHEDPDDPAPGLLVACLLAGTSLGPIVALDGTAIFGVKTGRERLEKATASR